MTFSDIILFAASLIIMFAGLIGVLIPVLPDVPLIFAGTFLYAIFTHFVTISWNIIIIFILLTGFTFLLDWLATLYGIKKMGASRFGMIGAILGMIVGLFSGGLIGLIIGAFFGAFILELLVGRTGKQAFRAGTGVFLGILLGGFGKVYNRSSYDRYIRVESFVLIKHISK